MKELICKEYWMYEICRLSTISIKQFRELLYRIMDRDVWDWYDDKPKTIIGWNDPSSNMHNENEWRVSPPSFNVDIDTAYAVSIEYLYKHGEYDILHEGKKLFKFNTLNELGLKLDVLDPKYEIRDFMLYVQYEDKK